jgi:hypothetical protein
MAKSASERRFQKRVADLGELFASDPESFHRVWATLVKGWLEEVHFRANAQCRDSSPEAIPAIYGVLNQARKIAVATGVAADPKVADSLFYLQHVCAKEVARITNPKLYRFENDCTSRLRERFVRDRVRD